jgi:hypothetical protein
MRAVVDEIGEKDAIPIAPAIALTGIMEHHSAAVMDKFRKFLRRSNAHVVDITLTLAEKAGSVRTKAAKGKPPRGVKTPDAIHIACAIETQADMLHASDEGMLKLSESPAVDGLKICRPRTLSGGQTLR